MSIGSGFLFFFLERLNQNNAHDCVNNLRNKKIVRYSHQIFFSQQLTCIVANAMAKPATHPDLSSKNQVNSSTHPWKKAFPVTVSLQVDGSGCRNTI